MKLWEKQSTESPASLVETFTVGSDREFDMLLAPYDVQGTLAHIAMLHDVRLISQHDYEAIRMELLAIATDISEGRFAISNDVEDVHSQIEQLLTERLGEAGKRVHTGRSRNDQVALDIKLYLRDAILEIKSLSAQLFDLLLSLSEQHKQTLMPGYTHMQIAMPSSFGLWFAAWAECMTDDLEMIAAAYAVVNKNPLGSAAGYGSSFPLNREKTTALLGFRTLHHNVIAAQMSRGRTEKIVAMSIASLASTLGRMAMDICLYSGQNFGFFHLPDSLTTGSSIMPHKKNPDIFELIRARCNRIQALPNEISLLLNNLPSGYHRDLQLTKEILFPAIQSLKDCMRILLFALPQIHLNPNILDDAKYRHLFSVETVNELVTQGVAFREAYQIVGQNIASERYQPESFNPETHSHTGALGNLALEQIRKEWNNVMHKF